MVDAWDLKSPGRKAVPVRVRPRALDFFRQPKEIDHAVVLPRRDEGGPPSLTPGTSGRPSRGGLTRFRLRASAAGAYSGTANVRSAAVPRR